MKIAYVCSLYPAISKTFILREVAALRALGLDVQPFSIRRSPPGQLLTEAERREAERTFAILPVRPLALAAAHAALLAAAPRRYARALRQALWRRPPGLRAALWHLFYFAEAGVLARELQRRGIEHVHAHFANAGGSVAQLAALLCGRSWSLTLHGHADFSNPAAVGLVDKVRSARFVVCVSAFGRSQAMLHCPPAEWAKFHFVRCGLDTERFPPPPARGTAAAPSPAPRPLQLLSVGRLSVEKGHRFLVEALALLARRGVPAVCTLVGNGPERAALEELSKSLGVAERLVFAGAVGQDRIQEFYERADVFVMSSLSEGLPVALMEAMAKQLPVVAPRITGIPELVESGVHGLLFPPACPEALADAIASLAQLDGRARERMGIAGRERVLREFDVRVTAPALFEVFMTEAGPRPALLRAGGPASVPAPGRAAPGPLKRPASLPL
jgi:glycosyltransferase involved in cell wall biosynthesis